MPLDEPFSPRQDRSFTISTPNPFRVAVTVTLPASLAWPAFTVGFWIAGGAAMGAVFFLSALEVVKNLAAVIAGWFA